MKKANFALLLKKASVRRPLRLSVRTADFHSVKRGSIPLGAAKELITTIPDVMGSFH